MSTVPRTIAMVSVGLAFVLQAIPIPVSPACLFAAAPAATTAPDKPNVLQVQQALDDLKSPDWIVQSAAMATLASAGAAEAVEPLGAIFKTGATPYLRGRALVALATILKGRVFEDGLAQSKSNLPAMRSAAAEALGIIGGAKAESAIRELLADKEPAVRNPALVSFARVSGKGAASAIAAAATSPDRDTVRHAIRAMVYAPSPANSRKLAELAVVKVDASSASSASSTGSAGDPVIRAEAANAMGRLGDPAWIPVLMAQSATDPDPAVRAVCERNLLLFDARQAVGPALAALKGDQADLYPAAVRLLARRPSAEGANELARLFAAPSPKYDKVVVEVLGLLAETDAERYQPILAAYLASPLAVARLKAIDSLAHNAKADLFELFRPLLGSEKDPIVLAAALAALEAVPGVPKDGVVKYLAGLLTRADSREVLLGGVKVVRAHITAAQVGDGITALAPLFEGKDDAVRQAAADALDRAADEAARRRIAQAQGYVTDWKIIGPFQAAKDGLAGDYPPDHEIDFTKSYDVMVAGASVALSENGAARSVLITPPQVAAGGRIVLSLAVSVPAAEGAAGAAGAAKPSLKLTLASRAREPLDVELVVGGKSLASARLVAPLDRSDQATELAADLDSLAGRAGVVELFITAARNSAGGVAITGAAFNAVMQGGEQGQPRDLLADLAKAPVKLWVGGVAAPRLAWADSKTNAVFGRLGPDTYFSPADGDRLGVMYGAAALRSDKGQKLNVVVTTQTAAVLYVNGEKAGELKAGDNTMSLALAKGLNVLRIKFLDDRGVWGFRLRLIDVNPAGVAAEPPGKKAD
jgi:HEAT repeat protein